MKQRIIHHRMAGFKLSEDTEILILGTFNPDTPGNSADFFYSRSRNYLWRLLPVAFGEPDLKGKHKTEKAAFMARHRIGFSDLITSVNVPAGDEKNYRDDFIDAHVVAWTDVVGELKKLKQLKKVLFTRKTFSGVPNIKKRLTIVQEYCISLGIAFELLVTPARGYSAAKQEVWTSALTE